jgi:RNA polymerase-binding transcription factor DksA
MQDQGAAQQAGEHLARQVAADLATLADTEAQFAAVDAALRRLDDGSYWACEGCGGDIVGVVADEPLRRRCAACGDDGEVAGRQ